MSELRKIIIDGLEIECDPNLALIQACELAGIEVPRFCYHERLSIAGNCRMCLVEPVGAPKPAASCHLQVKDLRGGPNGEPPQVLTNSPMVKKAREGVMEFLLINHPLDCPICDQGGECDLQDQAMAYGVDSSRFNENKRAMDEIHLGPLIKTTMTRCIQCTRCVRFVTEVAGAPEMGCTGRGEDAEIISYLDAALSSELQGNVIDLCPVGALTSRPYAFTARPWELSKTESIDVMDALGANIRIDSRGREVMRILPRENADVNEEWIDDKQRYIWDGLRRQRIDRPYIRGSDGRLVPTSWAAAFDAIRRKVSETTPDKMAAIAGDLPSVETMWALKALMRSLGVKNIDCRQDGAALPPTTPAGWLFNPTIAGVDKADAILLIGSNPRHESPVLNARLRQAWLNGTEFALIGQPADLTYEYRHLGAGPKALDDPEEEVVEWLANAARPLILVGAGALARADGASVLRAAMSLAERVGAVGEAGDAGVGFGVIHTAAARVGGMAIGFAPHMTDDGESLSAAPTGRDVGGVLSGAESGEIDFVYLLGADELPMDRLQKAFVVYQGSHGDAGAQAADIVLPSAAFTEEAGLFLNMEGRPQLANRAVHAPGEARDGWAVLRALSAELGQTLPFDDLEGLRAHLFAAHPELAASIGKPMSAQWRALPDGFGVEPLSDAPFTPAVKDFYLTNPIARASETMAELSKLAMSRRPALAAE
ncbi:MAG: NADH-quinone oxidoreductase subunit NuoG [Neomegalonema sp.]|nr:NADH-quinone oxidoreductase subunit NuoG [Neomegalonema sp.]